MGYVRDRFLPQWRTELGYTDKRLWELNNKDEPKDPWQDTVKFVAADPDDGELFTFTSSSVGGLKAARKLSQDYAKGRKQHPDEWPVIELAVHVWESASYGRMKDPSFPVVGWLPKDDGEPAPALAAPAEPKKPVTPIAAPLSGHDEPDFDYRNYEPDYGP